MFAQNRNYLFIFEVKQMLRALKRAVSKIDFLSTRNICLVSEKRKHVINPSLASLS